MRQFIVSLYLQSKKTLRTMGFIILFGFILLIGFSSKFLSSSDTGILNIAVFNGDGGEVSVNFVNDLKENGGIIGIHEVSSQKEAEESVISGNTDGAWIISEGFEDRISEYPKTRKPIIETLIREDNILISMAEEKLCSTLFGQVSVKEYEYFLSKHNADTDDEEDIKQTYDNARVEGELIHINYIGSNSEEVASYSVSPLRGILYLAVSLTAAAAEIYYIIDRNKGSLGMITSRKRVWAELVYVTVPTFWAGVVVSASLLLTGLYTSFLSETAIMLLTVLSSSFFAIFIGAILGSAVNTAAFLPVVIIAEAVLSPVLVDFDGVKWLKQAFPVYHGLSCVYDASNFVIAAIYTLIIGAISIISGILREKIRQMGKSK